MSQLLSSIADSPLSQKLLASLGVTTPVKLEREQHSNSEFFRGNILLGTASDNTVLEPLIKNINTGSIDFFIAADSPQHDLINAIINRATATAQLFTTENDELKFKALIFDASGIRNSEQLQSLYQFFHNAIGRLQNCARIIILGRPPEAISDSKFHTAQRALEGFSRCLSKEIGKRGSTVQLIYVSEQAEAGLCAPVQFFLSPRSAYVNAQVIRVNNPQTLTDERAGLITLERKVAIVTGAARGIGEKIAQALARDGATVIGIDIPAAAADLEKSMTAIGGKALTLDIASAQAPADIAAFCAEHFKGVDILVHNAGITRDKTLRNMPQHFWDSTIDINLTAQERINDYLLEHNLIRSGGSIVCVSSVSGIAGNFGQTNYGASKAGVIGMVQSMAPLLQSRQITINAVAPGFIETQMTKSIPFFVREVGKRINALGQAGKPEDVANTIAFLANPGAAMISGNVIRVCGQSMLGA